MTIPIQCRGLYIGGEWVGTPHSFPVVDPATEKTLADAPLGGIEHFESAVRAAAKAFHAAKRQAPHERADLLLRVVQELERRKANFVDLIVSEAGKPVALAEAEVGRALLTFQTAAEEARRDSGEVLPMEAFVTGRGHVGLTRPFPIGIIYGISPFNFPLNLVAHKVAPCLATGNALIVKPAPKTPLTALLLAEALHSAQIIPGQVNFVTCRNEEAGHLVGDPRVAMTSFTGSSAVGWKLKEQCRRQKIVLELGGNAAAIVHEDAVLMNAIPGIVNGGFGYAGQSCISVQRVLVHRPIYESFREQLLDYIRNHAVTGDPRDRRTLVGPMIDARSLSRVQRWATNAVRQGAKILTHGGTHGPYLEPIVIEEPTRDMEVWNQEVFGPLITLQSYDSFDQALALANDTDFGLQAGVFTQDVSRIYKAFDALEVGGVLINNVPTFRVEQMPYGGVKQSGFGREGIRSAMREMTEPRSLIMKITS